MRTTLTREEVDAATAELVAATTPCATPEEVEKINDLMQAFVGPLVTRLEGACYRPVCSSYWGDVMGNYVNVPVKTRRSGYDCCGSAPLPKGVFEKAQAVATLMGMTVKVEECEKGWLDFYFRK